jgi:hypothetical protein
MAGGTATRPRHGNGSVGQIAGHAGRIDSRPVEHVEGLRPQQGHAALTQEHVEGLRPQQGNAALAQQLHRLTQEIAESRQRGEQLRATLDRRSRRVQQLIGERDRLTSLLAEREAELRELHREHGALTARAAPAARGAPAFLGAARAMLAKLRPVHGAPVQPRPARMQAETSERPPAEAALVPWLNSGPRKPVLGVVVFGLSEAEIESVLGIVERHCAERDLAPLLLTDNDAFQLFRGRRVLFEFLPARADQERFAADLDWRLFTLRRLALIRRKWRPVRVVAFGRRAAEVVQLWLDSPFEATPVPASLKGRSEGAEPDWGGPRQLSAIGP